MDVHSPEISFVREGAEIPESAARAQPDGGPDLVPCQKIEPAAGPPRERHAQPEMAADGPFGAARSDRPDVDEKDVPVRFAAGRTVQPARDVDVVAGFMRMEGIAFVFPVMEGQARGARGGDGGQEKNDGRPVGTEGEREPSGGK